MPAPVKIYFASSNPGKLAEFRALAENNAAETSSTTFRVEMLPRFESLPSFEENAPTFGENALGKALYYSKLSDGIVFADDSGLVVPALGGAPGVHSARYAGPDASSVDRINKLLQELAGKPSPERAAYFCCVITVIRQGLPIAVISNRADGEILEVPHGTGGFGYDPIFHLPELDKTFAELTPQEKNLYSHRGKAFRRVLSFLSARS
ncbi:MAG TPA: RdgB/HAM1 family non-canonical purine NTP pyrophosphatase [Verrucomicrobiae bacterium]|nr:RdgB/HAM1 family non-canonical purine NTP pyrophosphatase [Verrucomicrobiae bacterium]